MRQQKETYNFADLHICNLNLAGYTSHVGNPLLSDFILIGQKLEKLGFTYYKGKVTVVDPLEEQ